MRRTVPLRGRRLDFWRKLVVFRDIGDLAMRRLPTIFGENSRFVDLEIAGGDFAQGGDDLFVVVFHFNPGLRTFEQLFSALGGYKNQRKAVWDYFKAVLYGNAGHPPPYSWNGAV